MKDLKEIIILAQQGNEIARTTLIKLLKDDGYIKQLNRYLYRNRLSNPDDLRSDFWIGVINAIPKVKHNVGNPLQYLTYKGIKHVITSQRKAIQKGVSFNCFDCGEHGRIRHHKRICPHCGSSNIDTIQNEINIKDIPENIITIREDINIHDHILLFKKRLSPKEKEVFELIIERGYERSACKNYLKEIGKIMSTTPQCVSRRLKNIRIKYREFINANNGL